MNKPSERRIRELRTMPYEEYLKTPEWQAKREQALERDEHCCRVCNCDKSLHVHHRTYKRRGNEDLNDLTTLCDNCHEYFHQRVRLTDYMGSPHEVAVEEDREEKEKANARKWEEYLIGMLIQERSLYPYVCGILSEDDFTCEDTRVLYGLLGSTSASDQPFEELVPPELESVVSRLVESTELPTSTKVGADVRTAIQVVVRIRRISLLRKNKELQSLIKDAANTGDRVTERQLRQQVFEGKRHLDILSRSVGMQ